MATINVKASLSKTISDFKANDVIRLTGGKFKNIYALSNGKDVVVETTAKGKITLKNAIGKVIAVSDSSNATVKYVVGKSGVNNTFTWANGVRYVGSGKTDTLNVKTSGGTVDLTNSAVYKSIDAVNASKATRAVTIKGGSQKVDITGSNYNDTIKAGSKGGIITGGKGNDSITAGAGVDTIVIANGMGTDTITGFSASDKIKVSSGTYNVSASGSNVVVTAGTGKAVIKSGIGKNIQVVDSKGAVTKFNVGKKDTANTFTWASGVNYAGGSKTDTVNVNTGGANADLSKSLSIENINASKANKAVTIKGGAFAATITGSAYADKITAGSKGGIIRAGRGNDTIYAGAGTDTIQYAKGEGNDTIYNLSSSDKVKFVSDSLKTIAAKSTGTDVVITTANGSKMTLKAATGKTLNVVNSAGTTIKYAIGRNDSNNAFTWANGVRYIGTGKNDTLNVNTAGGTVDLTNTTLYKSIDTINAGKATKAVTIKGGAQKVNVTGSNYNDIIKAGSKGGIITGGKGNDNITAGAGVDTIVIANGMGTDTITGFSASDKIKVSSGTYNVSASGSNVVVTAGTGKAVIKSGIGKNIQVVDSKGVTTKFNVGKKDTANTFTWSSGVNYVGGSKTDTVNVNTGGANADLSKSLSIENINASKANKAVTIKGGAFAATITGSAYADKITAGSKGGTIRAGKGNDTIYAGAGADTIQYAKGEGNDTIYNISSSDKIKFVSDSLKSIAAASTGTDVVVITTSGGKMTLKAATGKTLNVVNSAGTITKYVVGRNDANNAFTWASGVRYVGSGKTDTLNVNTAGGTVDLTNITLYKSIDAVNASKATKAVTIKGGAQAVNITGSAYADKITAGSKGGTVRAGKGNDTIYAGAGTDTIQYAKGEGNDIIYNLSSSDKIKFVSDSLKSIAATSTGTDVVITTANGSKMTLKAATGKTLNVVNSAGTTTKYVVGRNDANNAFTWTSGVRYISTGKTDTLNVNTAGGTVDLTNTTLYKSIDAVNASKATKAVTIKGGSTKTTLTGSAYADTITGDNNGGTINGGAGNDIITAGSKGNTINGGAGNDTIKAGAGIDTILISNGMGTDTVTGFSTSDRVKVSSGTLTSVAASTTGTDVVVTAGTGKVVLKSMTGKTVQVMDSAGAITKYVVGRNDADNSFAWANGVRYIGTGKTDTLNVNTAGGTIDLTNTTLYKSIDVVNASKATKAVTIKGGSQKVNITGSAYADTLTGANVAGGTVSGGAGNDTIKAGSKGGTLIGGKGNDKIYAGAGADVIKFAAGDGNDTVYNFSNSADTIRLTSGTVKGYKIVNGNGVITTDNGTITLNGYKANSVYVTGSDGVKKEYKVASNAGSNVTGTTGKDVFTYTGSDLNITNYGENSDIIKLNTGKVSKHYMSGNDVIFEVGSKKITVKDGANKIISVVNSDGVKGTYLYPSSDNRYDRYDSWYDVNSDMQEYYNNLYRIDNEILYNIPSGTSSVNYEFNYYDYLIIDIFNATNVVNNSLNCAINTLVDNTLVNGITVIAGDGGGTWNAYAGLPYGGLANQVVNYYGSAGIDTFYVDKIDTFYVDKGYVINNYTGNQDKIVLSGYNYISGYNVVGNDTILNLSSGGGIFGGSITVKDVNPGEISVYISNGKKDTYWYDGILPEYMEIKGNTVFILNADDIPSSISIDELAAHYNENIKNVDTTKLNSKGLSIYGDYRDNIIKTGDNGSTVYASGGNDTIYLNSSQDSIVWSGQGNTTVYSNYDINWSSGYNNNSSNSVVFTYDFSGDDIIVSDASKDSKLILKNKASGDISFLSNLLFVHKAHGGDYTTGKNVINYDGTSGMVISNYDVSNDVITINSSISAYNVIGHDAVFTISGKKLVIKDGSAKDISFVLSDGSNAVYNLNTNLFKTEEGVTYDPITDTIILQDDYVGVGTQGGYSADGLSASRYGATNIDASAMTKEINITTSWNDNIIKGSQGGNHISCGGDVSIYCNDGADHIWSNYSNYDTVTLYDFDAKTDTVWDSCYDYGPSYYYSGDDLVVISMVDFPGWMEEHKYIFKNGKNLHYLTDKLTNGGGYYYQSTLGCLASSVDNDTAALSGSGTLTGTPYQPNTSITAASSTVSELSNLQKQYTQY